MYCYMFLQIRSAISSSKNHVLSKSSDIDTSDMSPLFKTARAPQQPSLRDKPAVT